jgi:hypothetical protein
MSDFSTDVLKICYYVGGRTNTVGFNHATIGGVLQTAMKRTFCKHSLLEVKTKIFSTASLKSSGDSFNGIGKTQNFCVHTLKEFS